MQPSYQLMTLIDSGLFSGWEPSQVGTALALARRVELEAGEVAFTEGAAAEALFLVVRGELLAFKSLEGGLRDRSGSRL